MSPPPALPTPSDLGRQLAIETPENVILQLEIAGVGSRALAAIIDTALLSAWLLVQGGLLALLGLRVPSVETFAGALMILLSFASAFGYFTFFEALRNGQTPGKRATGIRVVQDTGHPVTFAAAAVRNLVRLADFLPPPYLIGAVLVALHPSAKRLGDMAAGTIVVRDRPVGVGGTPAVDETEPAESGVPELSDEEFRLVREFHQRSPTLDPSARERFADRLALRFAVRSPVRPAASGAFLAQLYLLESRRRRGRFAVGPRGTSRRRIGGSTADRLVTRKQERWSDFQRMAERSARAGLDDFQAHELPGFAARYREVAADLARARTYGADAVTLARLERLVAAGHNALYRDERHTGRRILEVLLRECPAAVVYARRYVLIACLCFMLPAAGGFLLLQERPGLAAEVLPDAALMRAEVGPQRQAAGEKYLSVPAAERPLLASGIITNNVRISFMVFAGGIFLGVGSLVLLAFNGLQIGAIAGHFTNAGLLTYLLEFVAGHGLLELFAIWVSGAAGLMLGRAILAPGELTRADALIFSGRTAIRMIGAAVLLLVLAGAIEGLLSAGGQGLELRIGVSAAALAFLILYLLNGVRSRKARSEVAPEGRLS